MLTAPRPSPIHLGHGSFILYRTPGSKSPPWPAVLCPDNMAPKNTLEERPHGYYMLILLLGLNLKFQWATQGDLLEFNPEFDEAQAKKRAGLRQAYECAISALQDGLTIDHWRAVTLELREVADQEDTDSEQSFIEEMEQAKKASLEEYNEYQEYQKQIPKKILPRGLQATFRSKHTGRARAPAPSRLTVSKHSYNTYQNPIILEPELDNGATGTLRAPPSSVGQREGQLLPKTLKDADIVADVNDDPQFIKFLIGPEAIEFTIPYKNVKSRDYLNRKDLLCINPHGEKGWIFSRPALRLIDPADFNFFAEYLSTGSFGHIVLEDLDDEKRGEAFAQCVSAWETAEKFGAWDLMDHIVQKLEWIPWDLSEALFFSILVYGTPGSPSQAHATMKTMLSNYLAEHYWEYVASDSDCLRSSFADRIQKLPELEADIYEKRASKLRALVPAMHFGPKIS